VSGAKDNCECSESDWVNVTKDDRPYGTVSGTMDCVHPDNECYVGVEPNCWDDQITWTVQTTYQKCQENCSALPFAKAFYWWPTGGGGCSCSSRKWKKCKKRLAPTGVVSGDFDCTRTLDIPDAPCYNSYAMLWGSKYSSQADTSPYEYEESIFGVQHGINISLDNCFRICSEKDACIGIKWTEEKLCWLQSWAFYAEPRSCEGFFVYRKEIADDHMSVMGSSCPCDEAECEAMTKCFEDNLSSDDMATCQRTRSYSGTLSELESWRHACDDALQICVKSPACYTNMTLSWEQGLVQHTENVNNVGQGAESSPQLLIQRSPQRHLSQTPIASPHAEVLRLPDADLWANYDKNSDRKISFSEFQAMLRDQGYIFPEQELYQLFIHADGNNDAKLCCVDDNQTGEWKDFYDHMAVVEFCPCKNKFVSRLSLLQASHMDKSGLESDLDHVYKRKGCR